MTDATSDADEAERILDARARALARPPEVEATGETLELVVLAVGRDRYGVPAHQVQEIQELSGVARVPGLPPYWAGLVNLHGRMYPVLNLRQFLGLPGAVAAAGGKVALVTVTGLSVALWVDDVPEVRRVLAATIGPSLVEAAEATRLTGVRGVTPDLLAVLDLEVLLADPRLIVQDEIR